MSREPDRVALAYVHDIEVAYSWHHSTIQMLLFDAGHKQRMIRGGYLACRYGTGGIVDARNKLAAQFLDECDAEWLFWIDTDMGYDPDTVERLLEVADPVERPIVGGLCFAQLETGEDGLSGYRCAPRVTIFDWLEVDGYEKFVGRAHYPANTLVRCAGTGAACILIHRSVLTKMREEHGDTWYVRVSGTDGKLIGEDISFCVRAAALGFPIYVHTGVKTSHLKNLWLAEPDFWKANLAPPATERVAVLVPVLNRPQNAAPLIRSLRATTSLATVVALCSERDDEKAWLEADADLVLYDPDRTTFAEKINDGFRATSELPWIFVCGDDVRFHPGWLDQALQVAHLTESAVVGTNDLGNPRVMSGEHATHMLISRRYVDEVGASWDGPGIVCHEGYRHWYVDDEIVTVAKQRGMFTVALGSIVEHLHPIWKKAEDDDTYRLGQSFSKQDGKLWQQRFRRYTQAKVPA